MLNETVVFSVGNAVMIMIGLVLVFLAVFKEYEPAFFLPIGFGTILVNLPHFGQITHQVFGSFLYEFGIQSSLFPLLLLVGVGTLLDFGYLLSRPGLLLYGTVGPFGILSVFALGQLFGFDVREAASIGMMGALNFPLSIFISANFSPHLLATIVMAVILYRSISPAILLKLSSSLILTKDPGITTTYKAHPISSRARILFPIFVTIIFGLLLPDTSLVIGMLMLGNLIKESNLVERLSSMAQNKLISVVTLLLGLAIGFTLNPGNFLTRDTILVFGLGFVAIVLNTIVGFLFGRLLVLLSHGKASPIFFLVGLIPAPLPVELVAHFVHKQGGEDNIIELALAINSGAQLINVLLGCIFLSLSTYLIG